MCMYMELWRQKNMAISTPKPVPAQNKSAVGRRQDVFRRSPLDVSFVFRGIPHRCALCCTCAGLDGTG